MIEKITPVKTKSKTLRFPRIMGRKDKSKESWAPFFSQNTFLMIKTKYHTKESPYAQNEYSQFYI